MALMDISSTVCLTSPHVIEDDTMFGFGITALIAINLLGIITASIVMFLETYFKAQYHRVKNKPVKLVLTRDFLEKLRPKKKNPNAMSCPELASVPREQMSVPNEAPEKVAEKTPNEQSKTLLKTISDKAKNPAQKSEKKHKEKEKEESIEKQPETKNSKDGKGSKDSKDSKKEGKDSKETKDAKKCAK
uniref:Uncharacterized protein n=1 Tax=Panagrolaimus sp. JU765 TaxID=591449 RepID=A0AC34RFQ1_9BILA